MHTLTLDQARQVHGGLSADELHTIALSTLSGGIAGFIVGFELKGCIEGMPKNPSEGDLIMTLFYVMISTPCGAALGLAASTLALYINSN